MKKCVKIIAVADAYELISTANYQSLQDGEKIKLWKISRTLKPVAVQFLGDKADALRSLVTEEFAKNLVKCKEYQDCQAKGKELPMTEEEYQKCNRVVMEANNLLETALGEAADKEVEIDLEPLCEDSVGKLIVSNGWPFSKADSLEWLIDKK